MPAPDRSFEVYVYQLSHAPSTSSTRPHRHKPGRKDTKARSRAAQRLKQRASDFVAQAGELRRAVACLSSPQNLTTPVLFDFFEALVPRLASVFRITEHFERGLADHHAPSGFDGLEFLLRIVKNLHRQIEAALAVAELEAGRCRRRSATFDLHRFVAEASRQSRTHYLGGDAGISHHGGGTPIRVCGRRGLWLLALVDVLCRAEEASPRRGVAIRVRQAKDATRLTFLPRGALIPVDECESQEKRQRLLGRSRPDDDPSYRVTARLVERLGGSLTVGRVCRAHITALFTLEMPTGHRGDDG